MIPLFLLPQALEFQACATTQLKTIFLEGFIYTLFSLQSFLSFLKKKTFCKSLFFVFFWSSQGWGGDGVAGSQGDLAGQFKNLTFFS